MFFTGLFPGDTLEKPTVSQDINQIDESIIIARLFKLILKSCMSKDLALPMHAALPQVLCGEYHLTFPAFFPAWETSYPRCSSPRLVMIHTTLAITMDSDHPTQHLL